MLRRLCNVEREAAMLATRQREGMRKKRAGIFATGDRSSRGWVWAWAWGVGGQRAACSSGGRRQRAAVGAGDTGGLWRTLVWTAGSPRWSLFTGLWPLAVGLSASLVGFARDLPARAASLAAPGGACVVLRPRSQWLMPTPLQPEADGAGSRDASGAGSSDAARVLRSCFCSCSNSNGWSTVEAWEVRRCVGGG